MKHILLLSTCFFFLPALYAQKKGIAIISKSETDLIPEGIAIDDQDKIFISSINKHKIIIIENGATKDFFPSGRDGFLEGLGMKIDKNRNWLWALSNKREGKLFTSRIHAFDLKTGKTEQTHSIKDTVPHLFNDLDIDKNGILYLTDTYYSAVYTFNPDNRELDLFLKSKQLDYPNGITFGKNNDLFIATYANGLMRLDKNTKELMPLKGFKDSTLAFNLDGLVYWNNSLIGVYNTGKDRATHAVVQYKLNDQNDHIINEELIDKGNPLFYEPTTLALHKNSIYVLANSHLGIYNSNKESVKGVETQLTPVAVIRYDLK